MKFGNYPEIDLSQVKAVELVISPPNDEPLALKAFVEDGFLICFLDGSKMNMDALTSIELVDAWARHKFNQE